MPCDHAIHLPRTGPGAPMSGTEGDHTRRKWTQLRNHGTCINVKASCARLGAGADVPLTVAAVALLTISDSPGAGDGI